MVKEASMIRLPAPEGAQGYQNTIARLRIGNETALFSDTQRGQPETSGRYACHGVSIARADVRAVFHQAVKRAGLFPEEEEVSVFQFIQKTVVIRGQSVFRRGRRWGNRGWVEGLRQANACRQKMGQEVTARKPGGTENVHRLCLYF